MPAMFFYIMRFMPMWPKMKAVASSLPYDAAVMGDFLLPTKLVASVTIPTLMIGGEKSQAVLRHAVQAVADTLPKARRHMLKGQTHNVSTKVLSPVLEEFFLQGHSEKENSLWQEMQ